VFNGPKNDMKHLLMVLLIACLIPGAPAQTAPAWSPAKSIGMFAYPRNQQNPDQQLKDESNCYGSAKQNTGVDPQAPPPAGPSAQQEQAASNRLRSKRSKTWVRAGR